MTNNKKYEYVVFIGQFSPFHAGHQQVLNEALELTNNIIILVGGMDQPQSCQQPFSIEMRESLIKESLPVDGHRYYVRPVADFRYNDVKWATEISDIVTDITNQNENIGIIGGDTEYTKSYLQLFPNWENILVPVKCNNGKVVSGKDIIHNLLTHSKYYLSNTTDVSIHVQKTLLNFLSSTSYLKSHEEYVAVQLYKSKWRMSPFEPTFMSGDAVVMQNNCILMVERGKYPGKGLYALPGGFMEHDELWEHTPYRELAEETQIDISTEEIKKFEVDSQIFDYPDRDARGRMVTKAVFIQLPDGDFPVVVGSDDAVSAKWIPLDILRSSMCFADHWDIIQYFLSR